MNLYLFMNDTILMLIGHPLKWATQAPYASSSSLLQPSTPSTRRSLFLMIIVLFVCEYFTRYLHMQADYESVLVMVGGIKAAAA